MPGIDLHIHSNASDGTRTPRQIIEMAHSLGLHTISVTDHDSVDSVEEAKILGETEKPKIHVMSGIELKVKQEPKRGLIDVEILGYGIDTKNPQLLDMLAKRKEAKIHKTSEQVKMLEKKGFKVPLDEVNEASRGGTPRRLHILQIFKRHNAGVSEQQFHRNLNYRGKWYVEEFLPKLEDCINLIEEARGIPVVAHPGCYNKHFLRSGILLDPSTLRLLKTCKQAGVKGVEVYYSYDKNRPYCEKKPPIMKRQRDELIEYYRKAALKLALKMTGGTDYHGDFKSTIRMGEVDVPNCVLKGLLSY